MVEVTGPDKAPADQAARDAALDLARSFIVQAPAGSGKTELLTQRYLKLLGRVEQPERILAITFTRKATQEMRNRVMQRLRQARLGRQVAAHEQRAVQLASLVLTQDEKHGWGLLQNPGRLRIVTIDALCAQLLMRDARFGAAVGSLTVVEDARPLYRLAIRRMLEDLDGGGDDDGGSVAAGELQACLLRVLLHLDGDTLRLEELLSGMLQIRDQWTGILAQPLAEFGRMLRQRQQFEWHAFEQALGAGPVAVAIALVARVGVSLTESGHPAARLAAAAALQAGTESSLWRAYWLSQLLTTASGSARAPGGITRQRLFPGAGEAAEDCVAELRSIYEAWHADPVALQAIERMAGCAPLDTVAGSDGLLADLLALLKFLLAELNVVIMSEGRTDFQFLAERALLSLVGPEGGTYGDVLLSEDRRLDHLLLDEFQDTSHTQHRLIGHLISGWTRGDGRSLFLVGDPMQSIYRFRAADVGLFTRVVQQGHLAGVPVEALTLSANFRSRQEIVAWVNRYFPDIFPSRDDSDAGAVSYHAAVAERAGGGAVHLHALTPAESDRDEAVLVAGLIRQYRQQAETPRIAVLVRARKHLQALAHELLRAGIDFESVRVDALAEQPVVQDLLAITRALLHPADRVAAAALLRGPWCGLRLPELHHVLGEAPGGDVWQRLERARDDAALAPEDRARLAVLAEAMQQARAMGIHLRLCERVEFVWLRLGGPFACAGTAELDSAAEFLALLDRAEQEGQVELLERLNEALQDLYAPGKPACVQLMTIHQAKGLEFDVVILPGLHRGTGRQEQNLIMAQQFTLAEPAANGARPAGSGLLMAPLTQRGQDGPSVYRYLNAVDAERQRYETIRLLYVAATRAKHQLHLLGRFRYHPKSGCSATAGSFMQLLLPAFESAMAARKFQPGQSAERAPEVLPLPLLRLVAAPMIGLQGASLEQAAMPPLPDLPDRDATALGQALHTWLELIHDHAGMAWSGDWFDAQRPMLESLLLRCGAAEDRLGALLPRLLRMLRLAVDSDAAVPPADQSHAELKLFRREGSRISQHVIDRLYLDRAGQWQIIDYKTGEANPEVMARWRGQLGRYAALVDAVTAAGLPACRVYQAERGELLPIAPQADQ